MSTTSAFIFLTVFTVTFLGLSVIFGSTQPGFQNAISGPENCLFNGIPVATCTFPQFNPPKFPNATSTSSNSVPFPACMLYIPSCFNSSLQTITNTGQAILNGLSLIGYGIGLIPIYTYVFFNKVYIVLVLTNILISVINTDYGVPFLSYIFFAFIFIWIFLGIAIFKPGGSGS